MLSPEITTNGIKKKWGFVFVVAVCSLFARVIYITFFAVSICLVITDM